MVRLGRTPPPLSMMWRLYLKVCMYVNVTNLACDWVEVELERAQMEIRLIWD